MNILSRKEALKDNLSRYFTGKPCKYGHISERYVSSRKCCECTADGAKVWRENNPEKVKQYKTEYRKNNLDKERENTRRSHNKHKSKYNKKKRKDYRNNTGKYILYRAKDRAKSKCVPFDLSIEDINIPDKCPIFNKPLIIGDRDFAPSLDRIVPELGYVKGNIVVVSMKANRIKNDATLQEIRSVLSYYNLLMEDE